MSATSGDRLRGAELRSRCVELRRSGLSYDAIGRALGCSRQNAHRHVVAALAELREQTAEIAEDVRAIELERLDAMLAGLWPGATTGDATAVNAALRVQERRAKLLGLDAPARTEVSGPAGQPIPLATERLSDADVALLADVASRVVAQ